MFRIYNKLPKPLQIFAFNFYGLVILFKRYNISFYNAKNKIDGLEKKPLESGYSNRKLKKIFKVASKTKYWQKIFKEYRIYNHIDFINKFNELPIQNKTTLNKNFNDMIYDKKNIATIKTSGSTGNSTKIVRNKKFEPIQWAYWWRYRSNLGIERKEFSAHFGSKMVSKSKNDMYRINYFTRQYFFNSYLLNEESAIKVLKTIKKNKLRWIHGFPSSILIIAEANLKYKILSEGDIKWVTTGGENLTNNQKSAMTQAFKCNIYEHYGLAEGVVNISECRNGHLHVDEDFSYVEFLKTSDNEYELIGTSYYNTKMPLIRYNTGDLISGYRKSDCSLHRGRIVDNIDGRQDDYILLKDGSRIGRLSILFNPFTEIREAQIIQKSLGEIEILLSVSEEYSSQTISEFKENLDNYLLGRVDYKITYTDKFVKTKSSKHRLVIREMGEES